MLPTRMLLDLLKAPGLCMVCYHRVMYLAWDMVMYLAWDKFMENYLTTLDSTFSLKLMPENRGHSGLLTVYVQTP